jgi:hypothetical protein
MLRDLRFESKPMESGNALSWLCCTSSVSKLTRPAMESGMICHKVAKERMTLSTRPKNEGESKVTELNNCN